MKFHIEHLAMLTLISIRLEKLTREITKLLFVST